MGNLMTTLSTEKKTPQMARRSQDGLILSAGPNGDSDDLVLQQISSVMRYEESEGPTKTDNGENDDWVTRREQDTKNGEKESGWTNPLGWSDEGDDDDTVL